VRDVWVVHLQYCFPTYPCPCPCYHDSLSVLQAKKAHMFAVDLSPLRRLDPATATR
jgi:hypothetical protein